MGLIRDATPNDVGAIAATQAAAASHPWTAEQIAESVRTSTGLTLVYGDHGHVLISSAGPCADVLTVAVHPTHQRQGIARNLLMAAHERLRSAGTDELFLEVRTDNAPARGLYTHLGYTIVGERKRYYDDGCDAVVMRLDL